ncbi:MAG TPA: hypothetical protein VGK30_02980 [Candidatus Binatia bacterium]|jgi:hypothetical protein
MSLALAGASGLLITVLARVSFRLARRRARRALPRALRMELRRHKLDCLHEPPERVELELELLLGEHPRRG